jgi:polyhydroxyalkanoate synthesis regulator phasin
VWAVAATAIAVIALLEAREKDAGQDSSASSGDLERVERRLDRCIVDLRDRLSTLATSNDVKRLESRLRAVEDDARGASADAKSADDKVSDLERRVADLEQQGTTTSP